MDKTPNTRLGKLSCNRKSRSNENNESNVAISQLNASTCTTSTPVVQKISTADSDVEDSPNYFSCTQEEFENLDVVWDWNSPQSKQKKRQKRLILNNSPKLPLRKHPSNNNIKNFEKLKEELKALREQIAVPDNEACLLLSPLEEVEFKSSPNNTQDQSAIDSLIQENNVVCDKDLEDLFNDSADEDLCLFSQQIENNLLKENKPGTAKCTESNNIYRNVKRCLNIESLRSPKKFEYDKMFNDSFDAVLQQVDDSNNRSIQAQKQNEVIKTNKKNTSFQRTKSEVQCIQEFPVKVEFQRTQSFELANIGKVESFLPKNTQEEIERKRQEALAKLQARKLQEYNDFIPSPMKCSPEEIEQKRLQALAKLEAKRQHDIIEKKRLEALRKLEMKKKNAVIVEGSHAKRL